MKKAMYVLRFVVSVISIAAIFSWNRQSSNTAEPTRVVVGSPFLASAKPASIYPSYNTSPIPPDTTGMTCTAAQLAARFRLGWNIGNTLEAIGGETAWGNPLITESYIRFVKQSGFDAIRIPCSWNQHANQANANIHEDWMNRVKKVVQYCINNDLYVLLNIHWDGGWLDNNINALKKDSVISKQRAFWEQIATAFRDFDEHLMFAGANEPPVNNRGEMDILNSYYQTFIQAVRSTGGRNRYRVLVIQGPSTDIEKTNNLMDVLPDDVAADRLMVEVHYYTPYQFTLMEKDASWGKIFYYWGKENHSPVDTGRNATWGEETALSASFRSMKEKFSDRNIPVLLGEYGTYRRKRLKEDVRHQKSVDDWIKVTTSQAIANGLKPFWWDTGGALSRYEKKVLDKRTIESIMSGANQVQAEQ